ncbi:hypothetical protein B0O95_106155 [Mycetohabitans endofungorum]|uniref:Uncharacterized protein n=1 Tax=Mycetohabitans endofungorum TaxID=417203 RepID=A0A2P5KAN5_9BURK|nr:hypothetical protein B0O95_106155 [Mycetohabitans endofungorum]
MVVPPQCVGQIPPGMQHDGRLMRFLPLVAVVLLRVLISAKNRHNVSCPCPSVCTGY